jgi:NADH dehydrogenase
MFDEKLSAYAMKTFHRNNIAIKTNHHVEELRPGTVANPGSSDAFSCYTLKLKEEGEVGVGMCVWSTGLMMNPFVENSLKGRIKQDEKSHGILTDERLQIQDQDGKAIPDVYALGDCAVLKGTSYPATAQVASQKAGWLAKRLNKGDLERQAFRYKDLGVMAYIGNRNAILQGGGGIGNISGWMAWVIWRGVYLTKSMSCKSTLPPDPFSPHRLIARKFPDRKKGEIVC